MITTAVRRLLTGFVRCAESTQDLCRFMVGLWHEVRVHVERRRRVAVSQATRDRPHVDAGGSASRGDVVAEVVQAHALQPGVVAAPAGTGATPSPGTTASLPRDVGREHERVVGERDAAVRGSLDGTLPGDRASAGESSAHRAPPVGLMRLGVLLDQPVGTLHDPRPIVTTPPLEIDVGPTQRDHLAAARARRRRQHHEHRELGIVASIAA